ncbi:3-phosphoshikimate 1-carboxyvinyltransferase, chloroplastic [Capsicum chinense]|nr:3-phosphoshikimate 1-carboxyvinyltransferase, chloroplastic [Capsicum chinense]
MSKFRNDNKDKAPGSKSQGSVNSARTNPLYQKYGRNYLGVCRANPGIGAFLPKYDNENERVVVEGCGGMFPISKESKEEIRLFHGNSGTAMRSLTEVVVVAGGNSRCGLIGMNSSKGNLGWSAWRVKEMVKVGVVQEMTIIHPAIISFSTILSNKASYNVSILSMMGNTLKILFVVPFQVEIHCRKHVQCNLASAKHCVYYYCWSRSRSYSKSTPFFDAPVQRPAVKLPEVTETLHR